MTTPASNINPPVTTKSWNEAVKHQFPWVNTRGLTARVKISKVSPALLEIVPSEEYGTNASGYETTDCVRFHGDDGRVLGEVSPATSYSDANDMSRNQDGETIGDAWANLPLPLEVRFITRETRYCGGCLAHEPDTKELEIFKLSDFDFRPWYIERQKRADQALASAEIDEMTVPAALARILDGERLECRWDVYDAARDADADLRGDVSLRAIQPGTYNVPGHGEVEVFRHYSPRVDESCLGVYAKDGLQFDPEDGEPITNALAFISASRTRLTSSTSAPSGTWHKIVGEWTKRRHCTFCGQTVKPHRSAAWGRIAAPWGDGGAFGHADRYECGEGKSEERAAWEAEHGEDYGPASYYHKIDAAWG